MPIGRQLKRNLENSFEYKKKQIEFENNLYRFQKNLHTKRDYILTQNAMENMIKSKEDL